MSTMPLKVLQVTDTLGMGGAETWLMEMLRYWSKTGNVQLDFLVTSGNVGVFDKEAASLGAKIYYLRYGRTNLVEFFTGFRKILKEGNYDAIHDHADYASGFHFLLGLGHLPPVRVTHIHNPWLHIQANYAISISRKLAFRIGKVSVFNLATHVCGTSSQALKEYDFPVGQLTHPSVSVLHCGFRVERFNGSRSSDRESVLREFGFPENAKIILFAGRLDQNLEIEHPKNHKNSWLAAEIARVAISSDASFYMLMAGAGEPQRIAMEERIADWGLSHQLKLLGVRTDIARLMRAADVLLFPSATEGLGMVAVEAQAVGLPVVASSAVPDEAIVIPDLFTPISLTESLETWANALSSVVSMPHISMNLCKTALNNSAFSIANSAARLEHIYNSAK